MHLALPCFIGLVSLLLGGEPAPDIAPDEFEGWFAAASRGELEIPEAVEESARHFRYVFVAGFANERMPGYFAQNAKELRARGVPRAAIHFVSPSSSRTVEENVDEVRAKLVAIADRGPEPLVVIAHSRGACDALAFALHNPDFVGDRLRALFLVQGPFGGSGVADFLTGDGPPIDRSMPLRHRMPARLAGGIEKALLKRGWHGGLAGMCRESSRDYWDRALADHADAVPIVGPRTFYVTSATETSHLRFVKKATGSYLGAYFGPNDGMVEPDDQSLPGVGTVLAVLDAGHSDLTNRFPSARAKGGLRRALTQAVIMAVGRGTPAVSAETAP